MYSSKCVQQPVTKGLVLGALVLLLAPLSSEAQLQTPAECQQNGRLVLASTIECSMSAVCNEVRSTLARAERDSGKAYAKFCGKRAKAEERERKNPCKENCQDNQAKVDQALIDDVAELRNELERIRQQIEAAKTAAYEEALRIAQMVNLVKLSRPPLKDESLARWVDSGRKILGEIGDLLVPVANASGGWCVDTVTHQKMHRFDGSGDSCAGRNMPNYDNSESTKGSGPEAKALKGLDGGKTLNPADLAGVPQAILEPLLASSEAQRGESTITARIRQLDNNLAELSKHKAVSENRADRLAAFSNGAKAPEAVNFEMPKNGAVKVDLAKAVVEKEIETTFKLDRPQLLDEGGSYDSKSDLALAKDSSHSALAAALDLGAKGLAGSSITKSDEQSLEAKPAAKTSDEKMAKGADPKSQRDKAKAAALREKLLRSIGSGKDGTGDAQELGARDLASGAAGENSEELAKTEEELEKEAAANGKFSLAGSETDEAIRRLIGSPEDEQAGILGRETGSLFLRVSVVHREAIKHGWVAQ